ncbi:MAG: hypothetical protein ACKVPX_09080 [Myxococcaceae bacterium]
MRFAFGIFLMLGQVGIGAFLIAIALPAIRTAQTVDNRDQVITGPKARQLGIARLLMGIFMSLGGVLTLLGFIYL